jgi:hypothetical protein
MDRIDKLTVLFVVLIAALLSLTGVYKVVQFWTGILCGLLVVAIVNSDIE